MNSKLVRTIQKCKTSSNHEFYKILKVYLKFSVSSLKRTGEREGGRATVPDEAEITRNGTESRKEDTFVQPKWDKYG